MVSHLKDINICSKRKSCNLTLSSRYTKCKLHTFLCVCACRVVRWGNIKLHWSSFNVDQSYINWEIPTSINYKTQKNTIDSANLSVVPVTNLKQLPVKINYSKRHLYSVKTTFCCWISNQQNNHKSPKYIY